MPDRIASPPSPRRALVGFGIATLASVLAAVAAGGTGAGDSTAAGLATMSLSGQVLVLDETYLRQPKPAAGVSVGVRGRPVAEHVRADGKGLFTLRVAAPATAADARRAVCLVVEGPGYVQSLQASLIATGDRSDLRLLAVPAAIDQTSDAIQAKLTGIIGSLEVGQRRDPQEGKVLGVVRHRREGRPLVAATVRLDCASPQIEKRRRGGQMYVAPAGGLPGYEGYFVILNVPPGTVRLSTSDYPESRSAHARYLLDPVEVEADARAVSAVEMTGLENPWKPPPETRPAPVSFALEPRWSLGFRHESKNADPDASLALGSGIGVGDLDGNGLVDLLVTGGMGQANAVLMQGPRGTFRKADGGLGWPGPEKVAVALGDLDNDGDLDVYQACLGPDQLFENLGGSRFREISAKAYVADPSNARGAAMADVDGDGLLDIFCGNYDLGSRVDMDRVDNPGQGNTLHQNLGRLRFRDVAQAAGLKRTGLVFAQAFVDLTGDGLDDLVLAHDHGPLELHVNRSRRAAGPARAPGRVRFEDASRAAGFTGTGSWMGIAVGDYDRDGDLDLFVTNTGLAEPMYDPVVPEDHYFHALYRNDGVKDGIPRFTDVAREAGVADAGWGWGCRFEDLDCDGWLDLALVTNMYIGGIGAMPGSFSIMGSFPDGGIGGTNGYVFFNDRHGKFHDATRSSGVSVPYDARALATPDLDGDGYPDLVVGNERGPLLTYRNRGGGRPSWIAIALEGDGRSVNRSAIGSIVTVSAAGARHVRVLTAGDSFKTSSGPALHFGLGEHRGPVDAVVRWPGGRETRHPGLAPGRVHRLRMLARAR
jgi:hypothetical protein